MKFLKRLKDTPIRICERIDWWLCCTLPGPIRFWWARRWIRKDEFHPSLDSHARYYRHLSPEKRTKYWQDIDRRRQVAHRRDFAVM
jgi:hypothetical protein